MNSFEYSGGKALKFSALLVELSLETMFSLLVPFGLAYFFEHVLFVFSSAVVLLIPSAVLSPAFAMCSFPPPPFCPLLPFLDICTSFSLHLYPCRFLYWVSLSSLLFLLYPGGCGLLLWVGFCVVVVVRGGCFSLGLVLASSQVKSFLLWLLYQILTMMSSPWLLILLPLVGDTGRFLPWKGWEHVKQAASLVLVGKLITDVPLHKLGVRLTIFRSLFFVKELEIEELKDNCFLFTFSSPIALSLAFLIKVPGILKVIC